MIRSRPILGFGLSAIWLVVSGCLYGFAGGGLPAHIKTVAILPFDNRTAEPLLTQEVADAVRAALEGRLGLRVATEDVADAVVRGTINSYRPDIELAIQADRNRVRVTRRRVELNVSVEIFDLQENRALWQQRNLTVDGEYDPPAEKKGREVALEKLVADIVDGAQSQW